MENKKDPVKVYTVTITRQYSMTIDTLAETEEEAERDIKSEYRNGEIWFDMERPCDKVSFETHFKGYEPRERWKEWLGEWED